MAGVLTPDDLLALWDSVTDQGYSQPIREAGSGEGFEVVEQAAAQYAAVGDVVNEGAGELYVLPWSGQTAPPASGPASATATVTLERAARFPVALVLDPGVVKVEEVATDFGELGPVAMRTNRRYGLATCLVFAPGEAGPFDVRVTAEKPGSGHNNPLPGSLSGFFEPASNRGNDSASVEPKKGGHRLRSADKADAPVHQMVGEQVELLAGANVGQVRRVLGYLAPEPGDAGSLLLAGTAVLAVSSVVGTFAEGERVTGDNGAGGVFLRLAIGRVVVDGDGDLEFVVSTSLTGQTSGATALIDAVEQGAVMTAEVGTATWRVLLLAADFGLTSTNAAKPSGGRDASLDALGLERSIRRAAQEQDEPYRLRVAQPLDVVSPAAIVRAANRALAEYGAAATLREVGTARFPGLAFDMADPYDLDGFALTAGAVSGTFLDGELVAQDPGTGALALGKAQVRSPGVVAGTALPAGVLVGFAGVTTEQAFVSGTAVLHGLVSGSNVANPGVSGGLRPEDELRVSVSYEEMRAFFLIDAPIDGLGEFGIAYDAGPCNAYDAQSFLAFYDGFPLTTAVGLRTVWQAVDETRAGGVGFDIRAVSSLA